MPQGFADHALFLFVPADRPERFAKAAGSGADAVIIDLEDAVPTPAKDSARHGLDAALRNTKMAAPVFIRINGTETAWHDGDVAIAAALPIDGVVLPKAESAEGVSTLRKRLPENMHVIAIVESAKGLAAVDEIAAAADRLAFGSIDFAADLSCAHEREALLFARSRIVLAARLAKTPAPIDGVTLSIGETTLIENDTRYGASLGFGGKLLIHPRQIAPARKGLAPSADDLAWALRIVDSVEDGAARAVDGAMVDLPVLLRARQIVRAHQRFSNGS